MVAWVDVLQFAPVNVLAGMASALLAVVLGTRLQNTGWRDYVLILIIAVLVTAAIIENFLLQSRLITCCLLGFGVGWIADDVVMTLNSTLPDFVRDSVHDVLKMVRRWLARFLGKF